MEIAPRNQLTQNPEFGLAEDAPAKPTFACGTCGKLYSRLEYVRRHERKHQDSKPFPCTECTKSFARSDVLLRHKRRCHPNSETSVIVVNSNSWSNAISTTSPPALTAPSPQTLEYLASVASQSEHQETLSHPQPVSNSRDQRRESAAPYSRPSLSSNSSTDAIHTRQSVSEQRSDSIPTPNLYGSRSSPDDNSTPSNPINSYPFVSESINQSSKPPSQYQLPPHQPEYVQPDAFNASNTIPFGSFTSPDVRFKDGSTNSQLTSTLPPFHSEGSLLSKEWGHPLFSPPLFSPIGPLTTATNGPVPPLSQRFFSSGPVAEGFPFPSPISPEAVDWKPVSSFQLCPSEQQSTQSSLLFNSTPFGPTSPAGSPSLNSFPLLYPQLFESYLQSNQSSSLHPEAGFLFEGLLDYRTSPGELISSIAGLREASPRLQEIANEQKKREQLEETTLEPEKKLLAIDSEIRLSKCGSGESALQPGDRYYISPTKFSQCFGVEHWQLPPLKTMTKIARRTMVQLVPHIPMLHRPTFVICQVPICIAFSVCTIGGPRRGPQFSDNNLRMPNGTSREADNWLWPVFCKDRKEDRLSTKSTTETPGFGGVFWEQESADADCWDGLKSVVRRDKTNMMVKSFCRSTGNLFTDYNIGLVQALIMYNAPAALSDSLVQRMAAHMNFGSLANIARQVGIFDASNGQTKTTPIYDWEDRSVDLSWKKWVKSEGIRRTAWVLYILDSICSIETGCPRLVASVDLSEFPLPSPDSIWEAPTASSWAEACSKFSNSEHVFEKQMRSIYNTSSGSEPVSENHSAGPFSWLIVILTLTRELIDLGEGKPRDKACPWIGNVGDDILKEEISKALVRWETRWWPDSLCGPAPSIFYEDEGEDVDHRPNNTTYDSCIDLDDSPSDSPSSSTNTRDTTRERTGSSSFDGTSCSNPGSSAASSVSSKGSRLPYADVLFCRDALPFFWFCKILLGVLDEHQASIASDDGSWFVPGFNVFKSREIDYRAALESARKFSRNEGGAL
ncbi:FOG: Zn-finger [Phaffia rhodozyma]|uniref:FOG: Zn-finger n=1 Tax=Phaffia rhodozyma TaxID=264483 RepID=A0A0F7SG82_PHARH|nr:FOG: Zn-finger [Phaffia rhodozyma]